MPTFTISIVNETFAESNDHDITSIDTAKASALRGALEIGVDEIVAGKQFFGAEVKVETANQSIARFVVSVGASPLAIP